jgi:hypothetical protein
MTFAILKKSSKFCVLLLVLFSVLPVSAGNSLDLPGDLSTVALAKVEALAEVQALSLPIEIRTSIPPEDAGIINYARVPGETGFAVLIRRSIFRRRWWRCHRDNRGQASRGKSNLQQPGAVDTGIRVSQCNRGNKP